MPSWILTAAAVALGGWALLIARSVRKRSGERVQRAEAALERLRRADAARIRFFGDINHELRTPLALILGHVDAALVEDDPEARAHRLRVVVRQARRLQRLADQALELTRLDAGALRADPVELDVVPYLEALVMSFGELAERGGLRLEFIARPRAIRCSVDPDQLTTVVTNLLSNALKYTPIGGRIGVAVEACGDRSSASGRTLHVTVADSGVGIPPDRQPFLFEPFVRGEGADRLHPGGAGIGLALASELTRLNGGRITVDSAPGRGSRFVVELPLGPSTGGPEVPGRGSALLVGAERPEITAEMLYRTTELDGSGDAEEPGEGTTLLVVDDSADMREWVADALRGEGTVIPAADGAEALDRARELLPDLVVTDARMRDLNGFELCRRLRADERTSHIPIVMLTVLGSVDRRLEALEAGVDAYLSKPVDARELQARVSALLTTREKLRERFRTRVVVQPSEVSERSVDQKFFQEVMATIEDHLEDPEFSVSELASAMAMSSSQLTRKLRALVDQSPGRLIRSVRLRRAADLLAAGAGNVATIAYRVGFSDQAHFSRSFKRHMGVTPTEYRRNPGLADRVQ